ncbi:MAG TPA: hypothetical protein VES02_03605 [Dermatophilaceae bacterium]|nr:hypothetical protein [Dermatophilaceae bacterium]
MTSAGMWVRLAKKGSEIPGVDFHDVLEEGLCFGWSESNRRAGDAVSYLQKLTPPPDESAARPHNATTDSPIGSRQRAS